MQLFSLSKPAIFAFGVQKLRSRNDRFDITTGISKPHHVQF